jgi:hypothetical protein
MGREDYDRNPAEHKGTRLRFRSLMKLGSAFRYHTNLRRDGDLQVCLTKGDPSIFVLEIQNRFPDLRFEGHLIVVLPKTRDQKHWYKSFVGSCPVCGTDRSYRVLVMGERPSKPEECFETLSDGECYDHCLEG